MSKIEIGIYAVGCGVGSSYVHGVLQALNEISENFNLDNVKYYIASSGATPTVFNAPLGTLNKDGIDVWKSVSHKKFINKYRLDRFFFGKPYLDLDYLNEYIFKQVYKKSRDEINSIKPKIFIPVINLKTLKPEVFVNSNKEIVTLNGKKVKVKDWRDENVFEVIKATQAIPILYNKPVKINGIDYIDGALIDDLYFKIKGNENIKKIYILTSKDSDNNKSSLGWKVIIYLISRYCKYFRNMKNPKVYDLLKDKHFYVKEKVTNKTLELGEKGEFLIINPSKKIKFFDNNFNEIKKNINLGYNDVIANKEKILNYLEN